MTSVPTTANVMPAAQPSACRPSCVNPPPNARPWFAVCETQNTPVNSAPTRPPTPCTPNASSVSS